MRDLIFTFFIALVIPGFLIAQIQGTVTDEKGEPLPFASVYVKGTSSGTSANGDGQYSLDPEEGSHVLVFQYVGYRTAVKNVRIDNKPIELNVVLQEESIDLTTIEVKANAEDPAYPIIRKAMEKRKYYKEQVKEYSCNAYIKGLHRLDNAPEKILGQEIGDLGGILDTNRQGIIYLSESRSELHVRRPGEQKEIMKSSKVSGDDRGFSFNRASLMDFNFYENHIEIQRNLISPIASGAFFYYRYKLIGTIFDEEGRLINKIQVISKRKEDPTFSGYIYIVEDLWNIQSVDLCITGVSIKQPILDTLVIRQVHVPVDEPDTWMLLSQTLELKFGLLGFKISGYFIGNFSDYDLAPDFTEGFFKNEIFLVEEGANEKELSYWDSIRPVPLTEVEEIDYVRKDSLRKIWDSKGFKDSIDQKNNKFKFINLISGYSYNRSFERKYFSVSSPLNTFQFNSVQGLLTTLDFSYSHYLDEDFIRWYEIEPRLMYSFGDKKIRGDVGVSVNFDRMYFTRLRVEGGKMAFQFNEENPISPFLNEMYSVFGKKNYLKLYDKTYGKIGFQRELFNGVLLRTNVEYARREALVNTSSYSISKKEKVYSANDPQNPSNDGPSFDSHEAFFVDLDLRLRINQKYWSYPNRKVVLGSKFPDIWIKYRKGISGLGSDVDFDRISLSLEEDFSLGLLGEPEFFAEAGTFFNKKKLYFIDYQHFMGNQTIFGNPEDYLTSFLALPYYDYSTTGAYLQLHFQHHFNGFILDKIPLLNKLGFSTVAKSGLLLRKDGTNYFETSVGLDNVGIGIFRLFRVDVVGAFVNGKYDDTYFRLGIKI